MEPAAQAASESESESISRSFTLRQRISLWLVTWAGFLYIRLVGPTLRFTIIREPEGLGDGSGAHNGIWCFWHRCVVPAAFRFKGTQAAIIVSGSFDGEYIAPILAKP